MYNRINPAPGESSFHLEQHKYMQHIVFHVYGPKRNRCVKNIISD